ncbi:MAG: hypothetical protein ABI353_02275, partial [Isosphaeraceae bacterium]
MAESSKPARKVDDRHLRLEYLGGHCAACRRSIKAIERRFLTSKGTFEFNHIDPSQKSPIYEKLIRRVISAEQLDELDKTNLLCRICHGIWTNQRLKGKSQVAIALPDGRVVKKRLSFHGLMEFQKGKLRFYLFADEPCQLGVYRHSLGSGRRVYRLGFELEKDFGKLLLATRRRRILRIWDCKGLVFQAERLDGSRLRVKYSVRFAIPKFEGKFADPEFPHIWVRNGKVVIKGR